MRNAAKLNLSSRDQPSRAEPGVSKSCSSPGSAIHLQNPILPPAIQPQRRLGVALDSPTQGIPSSAAQGPHPPNRAM